MVAALKLVRRPAGSPKPPQKRTNISKRSREYLKREEVAELVEAARAVGRYGHRDGLLITMMYRHGLRVSEVCDLEWSQVDLVRAVIHINRVKSGDPSVQPLSGDEVRALRRVLRDEADGSAYVFLSERGGPMATRSVYDIVSRAGKAARFRFTVHPHMLRHACGYQLANSGMDTRMIQGYLGHRNIQHTVKYTALSEQRFKDVTRVL